MKKETMPCKHNWLPTTPRGAYLYIPQTKQFFFACARCGERAATMLQEKKP